MRTWSDYSEDELRRYVETALGGYLTDPAWSLVEVTPEADDLKHGDIQIEEFIKSLRNIHQVDRLVTPFFPDSRSSGNLSVEDERRAYMRLAQSKLVAARAAETLPSWVLTLQHLLGTHRHDGPIPSSILAELQQMNDRHEAWLALNYPLKRDSAFFNVGQTMRIKDRLGPLEESLMAAPFATSPPEATRQFVLPNDVDRVSLRFERRDSLIGELDALASRFTNTFHWSRAHANLWLLTGAAPWVRQFSTYFSPCKDAPALGRLVVHVDPAMRPKEAAAMLQKEMRRFCAKSPTIKPSSALAAIMFAWDRAPSPIQVLEALRQFFPGARLPATPKAVQRAAKRAREALLERDPQELVKRRGPAPQALRGWAKARKRHEVPSDGHPK